MPVTGRLVIGKECATLSQPKLSISECTTYTASFEEDVGAYAAAGVQGIGLWEFKLPRGRDEETLERLRASGLQATLCIPEVPSIVPDPFFTDPKDPMERREALCAAIRRLAKFEPVACLCLTGAPGGHEPAELRRIVVEGLRSAAEVAGELGVTLGLEPLRPTSGSLVSTLPDTLALIDEIGAPNVQVVVDTWHFWDQPQVLDDLRNDVARLVGVQVNDWRNPTRNWCDRVLPGDGVIDLPSVFGALDAAGYEGWYDVEVFSDNGLFGNAYPDSLWNVEAHQLARRAVEGFQRTWDSRRAPSP